MERISAIGRLRMIAPYLIYTQLANLAFTIYLVCNLQFGAVALVILRNFHT
jgi:hypothetical protein